MNCWGFTKSWQYAWLKRERPSTLTTTARISRTGSVPVYSVLCECRKPKPGMLRQASSDLDISLKESYMIGDQPTDVLAGLAVGSKGIMIGEKGSGCPDSATVAGSLLEASKLILNQGHVTTSASTGEPDDSVASVPVVAAPRKSQ